MSLPLDPDHLTHAWIEHRASANEHMVPPRRDAKRIVELSVAMSTCTVAEIVAAVERHALMAFGKPGCEPKLCDINRAALDIEYCEALKEMALPLRRVSYLDAFEALRARMILANMVALQLDPGKPTALESEPETPLESVEPETPLESVELEAALETC